MSTVRGYGRILGMVGAPSDLVPRLDVWPGDRAAPVLADWAFPPGPPRPVKIPYAWLSNPLRSRPDRPITTTNVSQAGGGASATLDDDASLDEYGDNAFAATLYTAVAADPAALARHMLDHYATQPGDVPRTRFPSLTLNLFSRTAPQMQRILGLAIGTRILITDVPASWPSGTDSQVIEGVHHILGANERYVELNTAPVVVGPWFRTETSFADGDDLMPY